jgi:hypothetical protein
MEIFISDSITLEIKKFKNKIMLSTFKELNTIAYGPFK